MADTSKDNDKMMISKKLLITIIFAVFIPFGVWAFDVFFGSKDAQVERVAEDHKKDFDWLKFELTRIEKDKNDDMKEINEKLDKLIRLTERLDERTGGG